MSEANQLLYEELADTYDRRGEARQRDIFLVLAADAAFSAGRRDEAERLRARLLQFSPHNLLRPFPSFAEALRSSDIQDYLADLRRRFPADRLEKLPANAAGPALPSNPSEATVYKLQEPLPDKPPRRGRPATKSPYEVPAPLATPAPTTEMNGRWIATLLFVLALAAALALSAWTLVRPLLW